MHTFSLTATASPCPPECNFQSETKIEPDLRLLVCLSQILFFILSLDNDVMATSKNCGKIFFTVVNFEDRLFTVVVTCKHPMFVKKKKKKEKKMKKGKI